jgi:hypothetical protein
VVDGTTMVRTYLQKNLGFSPCFKCKCLFQPKVIERSVGTFTYFGQRFWGLLFFWGGQFGFGWIEYK